VHGGTAGVYCEVLLPGMFILEVFLLVMLIMWYREPEKDTCDGIDGILVDLGNPVFALGVDDFSVFL
jgi:hypothetical protein